MKWLKRKSRLTKDSVKEALDNLPSGICFFDQSGLLTLCNFTMHRLSFELTGRDLQTVFELRSALRALPEHSSVTQDGDKFILQDGTVWRFKEESISDEYGHSYTQFTASNVTDLYRAAQDLKQNNKELAEMAVHMRHITDNVAAIMREEETLAMKMKIHNELGATVLNVRRYYTGGCEPSQKDDLIKNLKKTVGLLVGGIGRDDEADGYNELLALAAAIGVAAEINGAMPEDKSAYLLIVSAIRECMMNCARHAKGSKLFVSLSEEEHTHSVLITNNGKPPDGEIVEGGGLSALRAGIEKAGGEMRLQSLPTFSLTAKIPKLPPKGGKLL